MSHHKDTPDWATIQRGQDTERARRGVEPVLTVHKPVDVEYETVEDVGGVLIPQGARVETRCACTQTYRFPWPHNDDDKPLEWNGVNE